MTEGRKVDRLQELRNEQWELQQAFTKYQDKFSEVLATFRAKNPGVPFPGSPEWKVITDEGAHISRQMDKIEKEMLEIKGKAPKPTPAEIEIEKLEDKITDLEQLIEDAEEAGKDTTNLEIKLKSLEQELAQKEGALPQADINYLAKFDLYNTQYSLRHLQEMAKTAGLSPSGLKYDLINRLIQKGALK